MLAPLSPLWGAICAERTREMERCGMQVDATCGCARRVCGAYPTGGRGLALSVGVPLQSLSVNCTSASARYASAEIPTCRGTGVEELLLLLPDASHQNLGRLKLDPSRRTPYTCPLRDLRLLSYMRFEAGCSAMDAYSM